MSSATGTEQEIPECGGCGRSTEDQWYRSDGGEFDGPNGTVLCDCGYRPRKYVREQVEEVLGL